MPNKPAQHKFTLPLLRRRAEEEAAGLPALLAAARNAAHTLTGGEHARRKAGSGEKFWQFRDYQPGDRPQDIDWRQSAKGDRVFIRQKEWQTAQTALFWCAGDAGMDWRSDPDLPTKREAALTLNLALALLMTQGGEQVALLEGGMAPGRSGQAIQILGQNLLDSKGRALPAPAREIPQHANFVLAGDFLGDAALTEQAFRTLSARSASALVIHVLDPAELALPFAGRVIFEDMAGAERHHIAQAASVRTAYMQRIEEHIESVEAVCRRLQWHWILHRTDRPIRDTLAQAWLMLSEHRPVGAA